MARRKKVTSLFEEQIPDDSTLERSVDNDEEDNELKDKNLPVHDSAADDQEPEKAEIPAPDADPKDLEKKHIEELAKRLTASLGLFEEEEFSAEVVEPEDKGEIEDTDDFSADPLTDLDLHNLIVDDEDVLKEETDKDELDEEDDEEELKESDDEDKLDEEDDEEELKESDDEDKLDEEDDEEKLTEENSLVRQRKESIAYIINSKKFGRIRLESFRISRWNSQKTAGELTIDIKMDKAVDPQDLYDEPKVLSDIQNILADYLGLKPTQVAELKFSSKDKQKNTQLHLVFGNKISSAVKSVSESFLTLRSFELKEARKVCEKDEDEFTLDEEDDEEELKESDDELDEEDDEEELKESDEEDKLDEEDDEEEKRKDLEEMRKTLKVLTKGSTLTESTKKKIETLFEAAVQERVAKQKRKYQKLYAKKLHESNKRTLNKLVKKIDQYHGYVVDEWIKENKLAVKQGVRAQVAESFIKNLKKLFETHNISIPNDQANLLDKYAKKVNVLEKQLNEQINKNMKERAALKEAHKKIILNQACRDLSSNEAARLVKLAESISFTSTADFHEKVQIIVENFFKSGKSSTKKSFLDEKLLNAGGISTEQPKVVKDKVMDLYARVIADEVENN